MVKIGNKIRQTFHIFRSKIEKNEGIQNSVLTRTEYMALFYVLFEKKPLCMKDIQEHFKINRSTSSELLTSLETKGCVEKIPDEHDSRIKYIKVTSLGKCEVKKLVKEFDFIESEITKCLSEEEIQTLSNLLEKIIENNK